MPKYKLTVMTTITEVSEASCIADSESCAEVMLGCSFENDIVYPNKWMTLTPRIEKKTLVQELPEDWDLSNPITDADSLKALHFYQNANKKD